MSAPMKRPLSAYAWIIALLLHGLLANALWIWAGLLPGLILVLPLAAALPGLIRRSTYTGGWLTLMLVFYVAGLLSEAFTMPARREIALGLSIVAMLEFVAVVLFVRLTGRERAAAPDTRT